MKDANRLRDATANFRAPSILWCDSSGDRPAGPFHQSNVYYTDRSAEQARERCDAGDALPAPRNPRIPMSISVATWFAGILGQSMCAASCPPGLLSAPSLWLSGHYRGRQTFLSRLNGWFALLKIRSRGLSDTRGVYICSLIPLDSPPKGPTNL